MNDHQIKIKDNVFQIIRYEGFGYVKNMCEYDKEIFKLEKTIVSNSNLNLESNSSQTIYKFEIIKQCDSIIIFIEDHLNYKYYIYYKYNSKNNSIKKVYKESTNKCMIL